MGGRQESSIPGGGPAVGNHQPEAGVFVGRETELTLLRSAVEDVLAGRGQVILLAGEAGIGKTRTAQELAGHARSRDMQVLWGRGYEGGGAPAYWPWEQALRTYVRERSPQELLDEMGPGAADLAQVSSAVRERLPDLPAPPRVAPEQERFRFLDSATTFFRNACRKQPMMLIVDDLHWVDPSSLLLLQFLARELADAPLLVLATYRDDEVERGNPLSKTIAELARAGTSRRIPLTGLSTAEVRDYVAQIARREPDAAVVEMLWRQTEGNPLFLGEFVRLLAAEDRLTAAAEGRGGGIALPTAVREVIGRRLERLSAECNQVLRVGAVVGRHFGLELLERVTQRTRAQIVELLDEALVARVVVETPDTVGRYAFAHALVRETLYGELKGAQRLRLHQQVGEALESIHAAQRESVFGELAHHFGEAAPIGNVAKAIDYARRAAELASAKFAHEDAAGHYERALQLAMLEDTFDQHERGEMLLALAGARRHAGQIAELRAPILKAAGVARQLGDWDLLARVALGEEGGRPAGGQVDEELFSPLLEEARCALGSDDSPLRARVLAQLAMWQLRPEARERRLAMSREAIAIARRLNDSSTLARVLHAACSALYEPGNLEERLALTAETMSLADRIGDKSLAVNARFMRIWSLLEQGDIAPVDREIEASARLAEEVREPGKLLSATQLRAMRAELTGRFDEAEAHAQRSLAIAQRMQGEPYQAAMQIFAALMFDLRRQQGRLAEVEAPVAEYAEPDAVPAWRAALALVYSELGRAAEARREVERLARHDFTDLPFDWLWLSTLSLIVDVAEIRDDTRLMELLYRLLEPYAGRAIVVGDGSAVCLGSASRSLGVLAGAMRRWEIACEHFDDAVAMHTGMGARPWLARTQLNYATMLVERREPGDPARALGLLNAAIDTARELGMRTLLDRATTLELEIDKLFSGDAETGVGTVAQERAALDPPRLEPARLHHEGEYWTLVRDGVTGRLKDAKGLHYLARLLEHPGREFHVLDLMRGSGIDGNGEPGLAILDVAAKAAYRERLEELREEVEEAERFNDSGRAATAAEEIERITEELASAVGLGGRDRQAASASERARAAVTLGIRKAIKRIAALHPALADHLAGRVKTGIYCVYLPDPLRPLEWRIQRIP